MKFKILPNTVLFNSLQEINTGIIAANATIHDTLKAKGFTGQFASSSEHSYLVACDAIEITGKVPDGWKSVGERWQHLYYPKVANKKEYKEIGNLPRIKNEVINDLLGFSFGVGANLEIYHRPGIEFHSDYILINTGNANYQPVSDLIEILDSEYNKLEDAIDNIAKCS